MTSASTHSTRSVRSITGNFLTLALLALLAPLAFASIAWADTLDPTFDPTTDPSYVAIDPASPFASGTGTESDPYVISDASQLEAFRDSINKGFNFYKGAYIELTADIDLGGTDWTPIGRAKRSGSGLVGTSTPFQGHFDGGHHTISGLAITSTTGPDAAIGLFGAVMGGTVENLTIADAKIDVPTSKMAAVAVGMLCSDGTVSNVSTSGSVTAQAGSGGVVGRMTLIGTISNCTNSATVTTPTGTGNTGGIVGAAYYTTPDGKMVIENCTNLADITGTNDAGGIVGVLYNAGTVTGNQNDAPTLSATNFAGGIVANIQDMETTGADVGSEMLVENNVSTTPLASIDATNKGLYAYNNVGDAATVSDNGSAWTAADGAKRYVSLTRAFAEANDGDEVVLIGDAVDQKTVTKANGGMLTLNLDGHAIELAPDNDIAVTNGTLVVEGEGNIYVEGDTGPAVSADVYPFSVKPAAGDSAATLLEGGSYDVNIADLAAPGYAELVKDQPTNAGQYVVLPEGQARSLAKAQLKVNGHTIYFESAQSAQEAAAKDPSAVLDVYDQSSPTDPDQTNTTTHPGDASTANAAGPTATDATDAAANAATNTTARRTDEHVSGDAGSGIAQSGDVIPAQFMLGSAFIAMAALALVLLSARKLRRS